MRLTDHNRRIKYNNAIFPSLPRKHKNIILGYVKKMVKILGIDSDCAKQFVPI